MQAARLATRLQREMRMLQTDPPPGVCAWPCNDKLTHLEAQVEGPEETVYAKGIFKIEIHVPERYPFEPPNVKFRTPVYHPNIDSGGRICLDILNMPPKGSWKPSLNIPTILASIGLLLAEPNPDDGLMGEITAEYKYNREAFNSEARKWTDRYALQNQSKDGMPMNRSSTLSNCDDQGAAIGKINASSPPEPGAPYRSSSKKGAEDLSYSLRGDSNIIAGKMQPSAEFPKQGSLSNQKLNLSMKLSLAKGGKTLEKETGEQKPTPDFPTSSDKYASREHTTRPEDSARSRMNWVPDSLEPGPLPRQDTHSAASTSASTSTIAGETVRGIAAKTGVFEKATLVSQVNSAIKTSGSIKSTPQGSSAATARPSVDLSKLKRPKEASVRVQPEESLKERRSASQVSLTDCTYDRTGKVGAPGKTCNDGEDEGRVSLGNSSVLLKPHSSQPHNGTAQPQAEILNNGARKRPRDAMDSSTLSVLEGLADTTSALTRGVSQEGEKPSKSMKGPNAQAVSRQPSEDPTSIQKQGLLQKGAGSQNLSQSYRANGSEVTNPTNPVEDKTSAASRETENVLVVTSEGVVMHEHISPRIRHPAGAVLENASSTSQTKVSAPLNENRKLSGHASAKPSGENPGGSSKTNGGPEPALRVQKDVHMMANPDRGAALRAASINKTGALDGADQTPTSVVKPLGDYNRGQNMKPPPAGAAIKLAKSSRNIDSTALIVLDSESDEELPPRARSRLSLANRKGKKRK